MTPDTSPKGAHTPGPWKIDVRMSSQGFWRVLGRIKDGSPEYHVANVIDANDSAQNAANVLLIRAAPDLLATLHAVLAEFDKANSDSGYTINLRDSVEAPIRAAISKAGK